MDINVYIRLCKEHRDLTVRLEKLVKYLDKNIEELEKEMAYLMIEQYKAMALYQVILEVRMGLFHIDIIEDDFTITYKFLGKVMPCKKEVKR